MVGGVGYSSAPREILAHVGADYGIAGDGEESLPRLSRAVDAGGAVDEVPGLVRNDGGGIRKNRPAAANLADVPAATRRHVDNAGYFARGGQIGFETKRGCPMRCAYCLDPVSKGGGLRLRTPEAVVAELESLLDQGATHLHTCDPEFNIPPEHGEAVARAIRTRGLHRSLRWYAYCAPTPFPESLARAMAEAGCAGIDFGADHVDAGILATLGRRHDAADIRRAAELCRRYDIPFMLDLLLGGPGETPATLARAVGFVRDVDAPCAGAAFGLRVYERTPLARALRANGPLESNPGIIGPVRRQPRTAPPRLLRVARAGQGSAGGPGPAHRRRSPVLPGGPSATGADYNYNNNETLERAIADGARGAFWDILRRNVRRIMIRRSWRFTMGL